MGSQLKRNRPETRITPARPTIMPANHKRPCLRVSDNTYFQLHESDVRFEAGYVIVRGQRLCLQNDDERDVLSILMANPEFGFAVSTVENTAKELRELQKVWCDAADELKLHEARLGDDLPVRYASFITNYNLSSAYAFAWLLAVNYFWEHWGAIRALDKSRFRWVRAQGGSYLILVTLLVAVMLIKGRSCHSTPRADSDRCRAMHILILRAEA
jgi:hypothetical protein